MNVIVNVILAVQMLAALAMIGLILIQHGKGADMGAAFGSGSSGSLFGASGSANFLSRTTAVAGCGVLCFYARVGLLWQRSSASSGSVLETPAAAVPAGAPASEVPAAPAAPASGAAQIPTK